jgi:hypothetical protein
MQVTVKLKSAHGPAQGSPSAPSELQTIAASFGTTAKALHPGTQDMNLGSYYVVELADQQTADSLVAALAKSPVVDGAYVKPADALP